MPTRPVIKKNKVEVEIYTSNLKIVGDCYLPIEAYRGRLTDLLNEMGSGFIPVTRAEVYRRNSDELINQAKCVVVNKNFIEAVLPIDEESGLPEQIQ